MINRLALSVTTMSLVAICGAGYGAAPEAATGNDITYWRGPFSGCKAACDQTPGCVAYTLHKENGANCWLKAAPAANAEQPTNARRDTFVVSDKSKPARGYTMIANGSANFIGNDITYWKGPFSSCAAACDKTPGCVAYTLHKENGANCWLKSAPASNTPK